MQHKWMVLFSALILFSLVLAPAGTAQAQVQSQEVTPDCPPYEPGILKERELLRSLPDECIRLYKEESQKANPAATARDGQPMATGGPDGFGYTYDDAVPYNWISATTDSGLTGYSEFTGPIDIGFSFPFYGIAQSQLYFNTNGLITFGAGSPETGMVMVTSPNKNPPNNMIAPIGDWLVVGSPFNSGAIYYLQGGTAPNRYFVVEWRDVELDHDSSPGPFSFEAILYENGNILFQYQSLPGPSLSHVGIEDSIGYDALRYDWNLTALKAIQFSYPTTSTARLLVSPAGQAGAFTTINGHKDFTVTVANTGSMGADTYDLAVSSPWQVDFYASNGVTPLTDTDSDSLTDTGSVPQGTTTTMIVRVTTPSGAQVGADNTAMVTLTSSLDTSKEKSIDLLTSIPANFASVFQDNDDGAMSFMTLNSKGTNTVKATTDNYFGYNSAVTKLASGNYLYAWNREYPNAAYEIYPWVDDIEYAVLGHSGSVIRPVTKLTNNVGATVRTHDRFPAIAQAPNGTIGMVWSRYLNDFSNGQFNFNIYFATLDASGNLLTGPTDITNNTIWGMSSSEYVPRFYSPTIAATDDNHFVISWQEKIKNPNGYYRDYIWYAVRNTAGDNVFSPEQFTSDYVISQSPVLNPLTGGKVILTWVDYSNGAAKYAVINSDGSVLSLQPQELGNTVSSPDAVQLPNGKVAIAWPAYGGVQFAILNSYYFVESSSFGALTPNIWGDALSVTTDADNHVIMTWGMQYDDNHLYYALGDSTGAFLTAPMPYKTSSNYIEISGNGQGNAPYSAEPDTTPPTVTSIQRVSAATTSSAIVNFTVTFSEPVSGVAVGDFNLSAAGQITGANIHQATGSGSVYTVVVNTGSGNGTLGLTVATGATIHDLAGNLIGGLPFTGGETYTILKTAATWQYVGAAGFSGGGISYPSFTLDGNTPYMAFGDEANDYKASVMKFNGSSWANVGPAGFTDGWTFYTSLAFDNGTPYVAFSDTANSEKLSVMKFNGTSWVNVGPAGFSSSAWYISLAFDSGTPYVAFGDEGVGFRVSVMKFNGTSWVNVGQPGISNGSTGFTSLAFNDGIPYVAFNDYSNDGKVYVKKFDAASGNWVNVGAAGFSAGPAGPISLAFNNGTPYVAFGDGAHGDKASVMKFDDSSANWVYVGSAGFSIGRAFDTTLTIDNGTPYVAFGDRDNGSKTNLMKFDGVGWVYVGTAGFSSGEASYISLAIDNGTPYVAFSDESNGWKASVMKFDETTPTITSILRTNANQTLAASVGFTVTFSEPVLNVDANDFTLHVAGSITGASVGSVTGSGSTRTVTVNTGSGNGTLGLTVPASATINDLAGNPMGDLPFTSGEIYTILKTATFSDVEDSYWAWNFIERLYTAGITGGCGVNPPQYCPEGTVTRAQMAVFLERGIHGSSYAPPAVGGSTGFGDVPLNYWSGAWIKQLAADGITGGCGAGIYCPEAPVTRAQMAIFLLRAKYGSSYAPPAVGAGTGFGDVQTDYWAAAWIKQLAAEGITAGCGTGTYCPEAPVTRAQMAVFLVRTFNLP